MLKFCRQLTSILFTQVEAPAIALRLFLLAAQVSDECGFEDLTYDLYVQAFTVYEDSISDSRAQLQAITLIIGTLQGAKVFSVDNYDTLITKAALHGAKLLKKPHQATAVHLASHMFWQEAQSGEAVEKRPEASPGPDGADGPKAVRSCFSVIPCNVSFPTFSIPIRTANVYLNAFRSRCVSQTRLPRRLSRYNYIAMHWINISTTWTTEPQR